MRRVLVVGSKGFIGQHTYELLSRQEDYECWGCDVVVDYIDKRYLLLDTSSADFNEIFEEHRFDICINCSGAASVPDSLIHPIRDFSLNTYNVIKLLDAIRKHTPHCRFINLSSAAVYGNPIELPVSERALCKPMSPYGYHKLYAESLCHEYHTYFGLYTCSLRIFSAYGPKLKKQLFWDIFQKSKADNITLFGSGNETRDFIFIDDIVQAIIVIANHADFNASIYNIGSGQETSIRSVATSLLEALNYKGSFTFSGNDRVGDPSNWQANIDLLKQLGFEPQVTLTQGVQKIVQWLREEKLH